MTARKKKPKVRRLGARCLLCLRTAAEGLACEKHKGEKVNLKHFVLPYVIAEQPEPEKADQARTLYGCSRCGYQLLPAEEAAARWDNFTPPGRELIKEYVCKSAADCARRIGDLVAGKSRVRVTL
jgi:hypothetical protein